MDDEVFILVIIGCLKVFGWDYLSSIIIKVESIEVVI